MRRSQATLSSGVQYRCADKGTHSRGDTGGTVQTVARACLVTKTGTCGHQRSRWGGGAGADCDRYEVRGCSDTSYYGTSGEVGGAGGGSVFTGGGTSGRGGAKTPSVVLRDAT